jgi:hypothetical protein
MKNNKRLFLLISVIITAALLLGFAPKPVQASSGSTGMSILRTGVAPRPDFFSTYLRAIHYGVGFEDEEPEPVIDHQLEDFVSTVSNGGSGITGVYINNILAMPVVQQPSGNAGWVSEAEGTITQFGMVTKYGSTGLLAHNNHAGAAFFNIENGEEVIVVSGNGETQTYRVESIRKFQALQPTSPYSDFVDLDSGEKLTATDLFYAVYSGDAHLTFQTCIAQDGELSWGRLFILATPIS